MSTARRAGATPGAASKAEIAREAVSAAIDELAEQLESGRSESLLAYLSMMGRFHRYSFGNIMLIASQRPDATQVAGFHAWKSMGRSVKKSEKGIVIIAPMVFGKKDGGESRDEDKPVVRFRATHVFDIAQTEGEPLPEPVRIGGEPGEHLATLESAILANGIRLETVESLGGADGVSAGGTIRVIEPLSPAERFSVLVHEWAHEKLHQTKGEDRPSKTVRETEAEAVAFVVSRSIGLDTGTASSDYIQIYQGDRETLTASLDRIQKTACSIVEAISQPQGERVSSSTGKMPAREHQAETKPSKHEVIELAFDRFARGKICRETNRTIGEGDIHASYSADTIGMKGSVRTPFTWRGEKWVSVGTGVGRQHQVYRVVEPERFGRSTTTYAEKTRNCEAARRDPFGFYDGIRVKRGNQTVVLCGPPVEIRPGEPSQGVLFGPAMANAANSKHR